MCVSDGNSLHNTPYTCDPVNRIICPALQCSTRDLLVEEKASKVGSTG